MCYEHILKKRRAKLNEVLFKEIFVDYQLTTKQFCVFNLKKNKIVSVISVNFFKNKQDAVMTSLSNEIALFKMNNNYVESIDLNSHDIVIKESLSLCINSVRVKLQNWVRVLSLSVVLLSEKMVSLNQWIIKIVALWESHSLSESKTEEKKI